MIEMKDDFRMYRKQIDPARKKMVLLCLLLFMSLVTNVPLQQEVY